MPTPFNQPSEEKQTRIQGWQAQRDSGAFWMGQCQKTDRPSCILELWFPELFPGMKTQHRPSQINTLVPRHAHGSLESAVAPPVSLVFMFPPHPHFPRLQDPVLVFGYMHHCCRTAGLLRHQGRNPGPSRFLGVPWGLVLRDKGVWQ